jgi:uncharacterized cupredoxin-like copper-binding protein
MRNCLSVTAILIAVGTACTREATPKPETAAEAPAPSPAAGSAVNVVRYVATDNRFDGPAEVPAGPTEFRLTNQGKDPHHLILVRLEEGRTFDSLLAALKNPGMPPRWVHLVGGPNAVSPGLESNARLELAPGAYAILCMIPGPDGVPHVAKGMINPLTVTPGDRRADPRSPDVVMTVVDYAFQLSTPLTAGTRVIRVENRAQQPHEVGVAQLSSGKKVEDLIAWELGGRKGEPPGHYIGGMAPLGPGDSGEFTLELGPGTYGLFCFVPDAKDGKPHLAHGMLQTLTVR